MIHHITYTDCNMTISAEKCRDSALKYGCDSSIIYRKELLDESFKIINYDILSYPRGCGYWLWKPQIIIQEMRECDHDDIVIYTDAGVEFINNVSHLIKAMGDESCFLFANNYKHSEWCKGDVMRLSPNYTGNQIQASAMIFKKSALNIVLHWLQTCELRGLIDDSPSLTPNYPGFQEHRHDQAILTAVAVSYGVPLHWWPASYCEGQFTYDKNGRTDQYPVIFNHHRKRNEEW